MAGLLVFAGYLAVTHGLPVNRPAADARGLWLLRVERPLGLDWELAADRWLSHHWLLGWLSAWEYATTYVVTTFLLLGWLWWRRPERYPWARNTLAWTTLIAIVCFALIPTTPPRLLPGGNYADIVARFHPVASWGSGISASADQFAALPSLHIGWAMWVAVVSLRVRVSRGGFSLAALHLAVTAAVVVATGNHYVLDIAAGMVLVWMAVVIERLRVRVFADPRRGGRGARAASRRVRGGALWHARRGVRVAAPDEFFLHVEAPTVQQPVGGFVILDRSRAAGTLDLAVIRALVAERVPRMPRFCERLQPAGRWRHARWLPAPDADLSWHVREHVLPGPGGRGALAEFIARLAEQELDRSRPMWQIWFVPNAGPDEAAAVGIMHHAFADGLGVVDILRQLFDPELRPPEAGLRLPSLAARTAGIASGLVQLAVDGGSDRLPFSAPLSAQRHYGTAMTSLDGVRELAHQTGVRVTDVILAATGEAVSRLLVHAGARTSGQRLRAAVPVTTRPPAPGGTGRRAQPGNLTAALRLDVPLDPMPALERLRVTAALADPRRRSGRALATTAVMRLLGVLPPPAHRRAARAMYQSRFFTAIVSNMPGPSVELCMARAPIKDAYPIVSLAEGVPLGIGTLGWAGRLCLSAVTDPQRLPHAPQLARLTVAAIEEMRQAACANASGDGVGTSGEGEGVGTSGEGEGVGTSGEGEGTLGEGAGTPGEGVGTLGEGVGTSGEAADGSGEYATDAPV